MPTSGAGNGIAARKENPIARFWSLAALVVGGLIVADFLTHPTGTTAAANGVSSIVTPSEKGLIGQTP